MFIDFTPRPRAWAARPRRSRRSPHPATAPSLSHWSGSTLGADQPTPPSQDQQSSKHISSIDTETSRGIRAKSIPQDILSFIHTTRIGKNHR